jgi:hypothetical protein
VGAVAGAPCISGASSCAALHDEIAINNPVAEILSPRLIVVPLAVRDCRETLRAGAVAYRRVRRLSTGVGERDLHARNAGELVYLERHADVPAMDAQRAVAAIISAVTRDHPKWL